jgi:hypothetical protein
MEGARMMFGNKGLMLVRVAVLSSIALSRPITPAHFSDSDKDHIRSFWSANGRYTVAAPRDAETKGPWQVRLSPEGSLWLYNYNSARGIGKGAAVRGQLPAYDVQKSWDGWISQKMSYDRYLAGSAAAEANSRFLGHDVPNTAAPAQDPGAEPSSLQSFAGQPPSFAAAVSPTDYIVHFDDSSTVKLSDNPALRPNYPSYRFPQGVMSGGTPVKSLPSSELDSLFNAAGITGTPQKVMKAVSALEGGFDSVNTYDTGYVSVGLIQFACLSKGAGSLGLVMAREKQNDAAAFGRDFHQYGLEVSATGALVALDIDNGFILEGPPAARQIINDKRLIAVFQHAGQKSLAFKVAQLQIAKEQYYPSEDLVSVNVSGQMIHGKVSDFVRSEAGLATLMDRKVNTGRIDPLPSVLAQIGNQCGCRTTDDFAAHEKEVLTALKFRKDYSLDAELSQPGAEGASPRDTPLPSRHGTRSGRGHWHHD